MHKSECVYTVSLRMGNSVSLLMRCYTFSPAYPPEREIRTLEQKRAPRPSAPRRVAVVPLRCTMLARREDP